MLWKVDASDTVSLFVESRLPSFSTESTAPFSLGEGQVLRWIVRAFPSGPRSFSDPKRIRTCLVFHLPPLSQWYTSPFLSPFGVPPPLFFSSLRAHVGFLGPSKSLSRSGIRSFFLPI